MKEEKEGEKGVPVRWFLVQGSVDICTLAVFYCLINAASGGQLALMDFLRQDEVKYFVVGPAILTFGLVLQRFSKPEIKNFENDPIVKWLGGPESVRKSRDMAADALRF